MGVEEGQIWRRGHHDDAMEYIQGKVPTIIFFVNREGKRTKEFIELVQGSKTVREYTTQFERLSYFAYHMIDTLEKKNEKYH